MDDRRALRHSIIVEFMTLGVIFVMAFHGLSFSSTRQAVVFAGGLFYLAITTTVTLIRQLRRRRADG